MQRWIEKASHWDDHPFFPVEDWRHEVADSNTRQSYHQWLLDRAEEADHEAGTINERPPNPLDLAYWTIEEHPKFEVQTFVQDTKAYIERNYPFPRPGKTLIEVFAEEDDGRGEVPERDSGQAGD
jgi:hypothetical protein